SMIADNMSSLRQLTHDVRPLPDVASDKKKSCSHIVPGKNFQQTKSVRVVGAIVISQRQLPGSSLQSGKRPPIPLPPRRHGLIARRNSRDGKTGPEGKPTHNAAIVNRFSVPRYQRCWHLRCYGGTKLP